MSRIIYVITLVGLVFIAVAAVNINIVNARQEAEFIQISVLADDHANYGVDKNVLAIPAVSMEIIEDTVHDLEGQSLVPVITYTSLPAKDPKADNQDSEVSETVDQIKHDNNQGSGNSAGNGSDKDKDNNGNGNTGDGGQQDKDNNGNGGQKDKGNDKNKDNNENNGRNDNGKSNEKESKQEKTQ